MDFIYILLCLLRAKPSFGGSRRGAQDPLPARPRKCDASGWKAGYLTNPPYLQKMRVLLTFNWSRIDTPCDLWPVPVTVCSRIWTCLCHGFSTTITSPGFWGFPMAELPEASREKIRVLIADADNISSQLMASALRRSRSHFDQVIVASSSPEAIRHLDILRPHVAVVSAELRDGPHTGFAVLQEVRKSHPHTAAIMLLPSTQRDPVVDAFRSGARGVFTRDKSFKALSKCIRTVHRGRIWASNEELEFILDTLTRLKSTHLGKTNGMALLTRREEEVVRLVVEGMKNREIGCALHVTEHSVSNYLYGIFNKLGVSSRVELILYATSESQKQAR
jgi:two-component system, NarL family, nitrate/nitrite response regulator NarL